MPRNGEYAGWNGTLAGYWHMTEELNRLNEPPTPRRAVMATAETTAGPKAMRVTNPELQAMAKIDEILSGLEPMRRNRVVDWVIASGYIVPTSPATKPPEANGQ